MLVTRASADRGKANFGWLDSRHTFSFGEYFDPAFMGFGPLRVINEDWVAPSTGFDTHPHRDMEIITYVLEGALAHKDSLGSAAVIRPGEVQRMTAGTGIRHSEFNASDTEVVHLLQIWILPSAKGLTPGYEQKPVLMASQPGKLHVIASPDGRDDSVSINQDAVVSAAVLGAGEQVRVSLASGRGAWIQVARGTISVNGQLLSEGDGLAAAEESTLAIVAEDKAEFLVFDMAM